MNGSGGKQSTSGETHRSTKPCCALKQMESRFACLLLQSSDVVRKSWPRNPIKPWQDLTREPCTPLASASSHHGGGWRRTHCSAAIAAPSPTCSLDTIALSFIVAALLPTLCEPSLALHIPCPALPYCLLPPISAPWLLVRTCPRLDGDEGLGEFLLHHL